MEHRATYCPEDNKLRFYPDWDDPDFDKEELKAAGYRWASKQEVYVCPRWTPTAEDAALDYVDEIEDETYSPAERAADRAERFAGYRDKRRGDAHGYADRMGDAVAGFQDQRKADRAARKRDRLAGHALTQWDRAEYWHSRTAGVIAHAIGKESPTTRRLRIKRLEADLRTLTRDIDTARNHWDGFRRVLSLPGNNQPIGEGAPTSGNPRLVKSQGRGVSCVVDHTATDCPIVLVFTLANYTHSGYDFPHPRTGETSSLYHHLTDKVDPITPKEAADLYLNGIHEDGPGRSGSHADRWARHYAFRLEFERAMLASEGGAADDFEIVPGGWVLLRGEMGRWCLEHAPSGWTQVQRVHKSPATKKATSVEVWGTYRAAGKDPKRQLVKVKIDRFGADRYREPTAEELEAFKAQQKAEKKAAKKNGPKKAPLINPTQEDAERLQMLLNSFERSEDRHAKTIDSTQKAYSQQSKGSYSPCETITIGEKGHPFCNHYGGGVVQKTTQRVEVFKVRVYKPGGCAPRVVILTDKPQKRIPFDAIDDARATCPTEETHGRAFAELFARRESWGYEFANLPEDERQAAKQLRQDAGYLGWACISCANQFDLTTEGAAVLERWKVEEDAAEPASAGMLF